MTKEQEKIKSDVYAIFKAKYPTKNTTPDDELGILTDIENGIVRGVDSVSDSRIRDILKLYLDNLKDFDERFRMDTFRPQDTTTRLISAYFQTQAQVNGIASKESISEMGDGTIQKLVSKIVAGSDNKWSEFIDSFVTVGFLSQESANYLIDFIKTMPIGGVVSVAMLVLSVLSGFTKVSTDLMCGDFVKKMNAKFTPNYLDTSSLIKALHIAPEKTEEINKKIAENGLDQSDIDLLKISNYSLYDVQQIRECYWREIISKDVAIARLAELGFTPQRTIEIMGTWEVIPGPQDLLWMVGKEAFEPDQIAKFGLSAEFPAEQISWLKKQGISQEWAMKYWVAHWDYPGESRVLELYHRGLINDDDLDAFYRVIEMPPFWREKLKKASYSLYTRVDLRRMHDLDIISEQEVYDNFRAEGYDDIHAKNMVKFYLKYNEDNDKNLSKAQVENAYKSDLITKEQAITMLTKLKYTIDQSNFLVEMVDYDEMISMQKIRIKTVQKSYKNYDITVNEARRLLAELKVETKWIDFYITTWEAEIQLEEKSPPVEDIFGWFNSGIIGPDEFILYLKRIGYSDKTIRNYMTTPPTKK